MSETAANLLVISDLHLGDGIRVDTAPVNTCVELRQFIEHYTEKRHDNLPWRLIINGDMVDFIGICLMPEEAGLISDLHPDDHYYGLSNRPHAAALKMTHVLSHHADIFRAMARFIGHGNEVIIVVGNHDAAFHFVEVQQALREALQEFWAQEDEAHQIDAISGDELGRALTFCPWFYFEEGVAWIEHGHQYDPYCSFDSVLDPATDERDLDPNIDSAILHYVANHSMPMRSNSWGKGFFWYLQWSFNQGFSRLLTIYGGYRDMIINLVEQWQRRTFHADWRATRRSRHEERLRAVATKAKLPEEVLTKLHALRQRPIINELRTLLQGLMVDRLALLLLTPMVLLFAMIMPWPANIAILGVSAVVVIPLARLAAQPRISADPRAFMQQVTGAIRNHTKVPIVVFGHSHDATVEHDEADNGIYFNTGSWVPHNTSGDLGAFTHVMIQRTDEGIKAMLCQWQDGKSAVLG